MGMGRNKDLLPYFTQNLLRICQKERKGRGECGKIVVIKIYLFVSKELRCQTY